MLENTVSQENTASKHVAIIMDGNGRWANARGKQRTFGHKAGVDAVRRAVCAAPELGVKHLTLYAFSSENWSRPAQEVSDLLGLLKLFIRSDLADLAANNVCVRIIGSRDDLKPEILNLIEMAEQKTKQNTGLYLNIAFNYGGRDEIVRAAQKIIDDENGPVSREAKITADDFSAALDTHLSPDPDVVIRTSGEQRISNFLLWQIAYAELVFVDCLWPDFSKEHFAAALAEYESRDRRYGGVAPTKDAAL